MGQFQALKMGFLEQFVHNGRALLGHRSKAILLSGAACFGAVLLVQRVNSRREQKKRILEAQRRREKSFQVAERALLEYKQSHPMTNALYILSLSLSELTKQLQESALSPEEVFYTYLEKTLDVHQKLNCCTEIILDSFEQLKTIGSCKRGILYGVPLSLKENLLLKNHDSSCGVVKYLNQPADDDCVLVKVLKEQGAIPFVRTNFPQALLNYDCSNPIYGQTLNPHNLQKTAGGSSGGEAALIGAGGSVIGIGTDIGGSARIPASFCAICGFKPTAGRLSSKGCKSIFRGQKTVLSTPGPMARDVDSLALFMKAEICEQMVFLDPTTPLLPFDEGLYQSRNSLRIGYFDCIEQTPTSPSMTRGVQEVKALLEQAGHTLVPFTPVRILDMAELMSKGALADGGATFLQQLEGSPVDPVLHAQVAMYRLPICLRKVLAFILKPFWPSGARLLRSSAGVGSAAGVWKLHASIEDCVNDTIAQWRRLNLDVVLCPIIGPAFNFCYCGKLMSMVPHSMTYNLLNFCAGVVPVSTVTEEDERNLCHLDKGGWFNRVLKKAITGGVGLPVAVQCVALPWHDELCLRFMKEVEELVKKARKDEELK
uniref:Fatty-acid amide hydrolase 1 n=1 Tax=Neogobius melanostomus TaxID=47308 RepID=A0A8C6T3I7_9GOBI